MRTSCVQLENSKKTNSKFQFKCIFSYTSLEFVNVRDLSATRVTYCHFQNYFLPTFLPILQPS